MSEFSTISTFDRTYGSLDGVPEVVRTQPATIRAPLPIIGLAQTYIVQTVRHKEIGDTIFLETVAAEGTIRLVIPPKVADAIARQRDALTDKNRSRAAKAAAADRKARGIQPGFLKNKKGGSR